MDKILDLGISYPDFQLNQIIDPEQIDMNNAQIVDKINRVIIAINRITQGNTGASEIGMGLLPEFPTAKTVQSALNQIATYCKTNNTSIADLTNYNTTQDTRMQTIESKNTEQDTKLQELVSKNTTQDTRMASIERKDSEQDNRIGNIETLNTSQNTRLTGVEQKNTDQDTKLATHETRITNVEQKVEQKDTEQDKRLTDLEVKDDLDETWINGISYRVDKNTNDIVKVNNTLDEIKEVNANVELVNARTSGHTGEAFPYIGDRIDDLEIATGTDIPSNKRGKFTRIITKGEGTQTWENDVKLGSIQIHEQDNNAHTQQFTRHELDNKSHLDIRQDLSSLGQTVSDSVVELNTKINTEVNKLTSQIDNTNNDMQTVDSILNDKITTVDDKITVLSDELNGVILYKSFNDINSTFTHDTSIDDVISNMSNNSRLVSEVATTSTINYPELSGQLIIEKTNEYRVNLMYFGYGNRKIYNSSWVTHQSPKFKGWQLITKDLSSELKEVDLNNAIHEGVFFTRDNAHARSILNIPIANILSFNLEVKRVVYSGQDKYLKQVITHYGIGCSYERGLNGGVWSEWKQIATTDKIDISFPFNSNFANPTSTDYPFKVVRNESLKTVRLYICARRTDNAIINASGVAIGVLPVGYRPITNTSGILMNDTGDFAMGSGLRVRVYTNGQINIYGNGKATIVYGTLEFDCI